MFGLQRPEAADFVSLFVFVFAFECIQFFFFQTLDAFSNRMLITFEYSVGKITYFNANGGRIFIDLG